VAAGTVVIALVAFLCGVQMGKSLSELRGAGEPGARDQDQKGQSPPFRFMEREKETQGVPASRVGNSVAGERPKDGEGVSLQPTAKAGSGKPLGSAEEKTAPPKPKYALQVAAFNNSVEAQEMVNRLKKKGYDAYRVTGNAAAKGTLHRVRIGHFESLQEARQFALTFEKKENMKPIISSGPNP
jgi:cell division septation protein DedD